MARVKQAFPDFMTSQLHAAIRAFADIEREFSRVEFERQELLELFVDQNYWESLSTAYTLLEGGERFEQNLYVDLRDVPELVELDNDVRWTTRTFKFRWRWLDNANGFMVPVHDGGNVTKPTKVRNRSPAVYDKFTKCVDDTIRIGREWGLVNHVLKRLNESCTTISQVRWLWPCIIPLMRKANIDRGFIMRYAEPSSRAGDSAKVDPDTARYLKRTYDTIARGVLFTADLPPQRGKPNPLPFEYSMADDAFTTAMPYSNGFRGL